MSLSFDDEESFVEAAGSLCFNNPQSDPNELQQVGSITNTLSQEENENMYFNNPPSDRKQVLNSESEK